MSWLVSLVVTSLLGSYLITKIFDTIFGGILGPAASTAKNSVFVSTWTAITTGLGLRGINKTARNLRQRGKGVGPRKTLH